MTYANEFAAPFSGPACSLRHSSSGSLGAGFSVSDLTSPRRSHAVSTSSAIFPALTLLSFVRREQRHLFLSTGIIGVPDPVPMVEHRCLSPLWRFPAIKSW